MSIKQILLVDDAKKYIRPEELIALIAFIFLLIFSAYFKSSINTTPYILVMFILFTPIFIIPMLVLQHRSFVTTILYLLKILRDWIPPVACLVFYENLHDLVHLIHPVDYDKVLLSIDKWLFGISPSLYLERFASTNMNEYFYFSYMTFFFYPALSLGILYYQGRMKAFRNMTIAIVMTLYIGFLGYVAVPAIGPQYTLVKEYNVDLQGYTISKVQKTIDNLFRVSRDCFPSLHFSLSAVLLILAFKNYRWLFWIYFPFILSLWVSTLYLRYHYAIDLIAGIPLVAFVIYTSPKLTDWWYKSIPIDK